MYVDFEEVVAEAVAVIGSDDENAKNFCRQFIWRARQQLGVSESEVEVTKIEAKNFLLKKPKNFDRLVEIALYGDADNFIPHNFHSGKTRIYPNEEAIQYDVVVDTTTGEEETRYEPVDLSESATSFVIGTNGSDVNYAMVRYYSKPLDPNGLPLIREDEVEACIAYCRWRWSQRRNENQSEIAQNKLDWMQAADRCVAMKKSKDNHEENKKAQAKNLNRMIPNFNRSTF